MVKCTCGKWFKSDSALASHRAAKEQNGSNCDGPRTPSKREIRNQNWAANWIWKNIQNRKKPILQIRFDDIQPSAVSVTSAIPYDLLCSYDWPSHRRGINIPGKKLILHQKYIYAVRLICLSGHAAHWQNLNLPVTLVPDKESSSYGDTVLLNIPEYSFEPIFQALAVMKPTFRFDGIDVVLDRNSLRKLLDFTSGRISQDFRLELLIVDNTLFIERCERNVRDLVGMTISRGYGRNFEKVFTEHQAASEDSGAHHRVLNYCIGDLNCAVRFEVDACYRIGDDDGDIDCSLPFRPDDMSIDVTNIHSIREAMMPQSTAAELKSTGSSKSLGNYLPQLWFGRTPWLIIGKHDKGAVNSVQIIEAGKLFPEWETKHQDQLRKLAWIITELKNSVANNGKKNCIAVCKKTDEPKRIQIFQSRGLKHALPENMINQFWSSSTDQLS